METTSDNNSHTSTRKEARLSSKLLEPISRQILEHTKQLGLFDEMRVRLLDCIETSRDFGKLRREFQAQMGNFCNQVDLSLPRAKLREHLTCHLLQQTSQKLRDLVRSEISSKRQRHEIRRLYNKRALDYIEANILEKEEPPPMPGSPSDCLHHQHNSLQTDTTAQQHSSIAPEPAGQEVEPPETDTMPYLSTGSSHSSTTTTDSGFSSLLAVSTSPPSPPPPPPLPEVQKLQNSKINQESAKGESSAVVVDTKPVGYHIPKIKRDPPQKAKQDSDGALNSTTNATECTKDNQKKSCLRESSDKESSRIGGQMIRRKDGRKRKKNKRREAFGRWSHQFQMSRRRPHQRFSRRRGESSSSSSNCSSSTSTNDETNQRGIDEKATGSKGRRQREECSLLASQTAAHRKRPRTKSPGNDTSRAPLPTSTTTTANIINKHN